MVVVVLPDTFRGMGAWRIPKKPNSRATHKAYGPEVKNEGSSAKDGVPKAQMRDNPKGGKILQMMSAGAARRILLPFYPT